MTCRRLPPASRTRNSACQTLGRISSRSTYPAPPQWGAVVYLAWSSPRLRSKSATLTEVIDEHWHMLDEESEQ